MLGEIIAISINEARGQLKQPVDQAMAVANSGLMGDGHQGDWARQVTCLNYQSLIKSNEAHQLKMRAGDFAENLLIDGLDFCIIAAGSRLRIGSEVMLEVSQVGKEDHPSIVLKTFGVSLLPQEGLFCRVIAGGLINTGDSVEVMA